MKTITIIIAKKDLFNDGKCFSKGKEYKVNGIITIEPSLMEKAATNDQGQPHIIGSWWREFTIKKRF
jgi:hypothetical protein